jgi:hypothetical protein
VKGGRQNREEAEGEEREVSSRHEGRSVLSLPFD